MDCVSARDALLGYHLGSCEDDARERLEAHLLGCPGCLRAYLGLRRAVEAAAPASQDSPGAAGPQNPAAPRPSTATRLRLRAEVARRFRPTPARRLRRLLGRPVPLYQAAAAALLLLCLGLLPRWLGAPAPLPAAAPEWGEALPARAPRPRADPALREVIDTSRPEAASLSIL